MKRVSYERSCAEVFTMANKQMRQGCPMLVGTVDGGAGAMQTGHRWQVSLACT